VSALLAGSVLIPRETLALEGLVGLLITILAAALLFRWLSPVATVVIAAMVVGPYLVLVIAGARLLDRLHPLPGLPLARLAAALHQHPGPERDPDTSSNPTHHLLGLIVVDIALIIGGSFGMVQAALSLGADWHIANAVLGVLILAPLTSLPNAATAIRLGLAGRGAALVGETFNSNSINLGVGVIGPSVFVTFTALTSVGKQQLGWLLAMTVATLVLLAGRRGMGRSGAAVLILLYFAFAAGTLVG
jgi:cation:H+ antiporter